MKWVLVVLSAVLAASCGGRDTVASKSAAAYRQSPVQGGGHDHHDAGSGTPSTSATTADAHAGHAMEPAGASSPGAPDAHAGHVAPTSGSAAGGAQDAHAGHAMPSTGRAAAGGAQDAHAGHAMPSAGRAAAGGAQDAHAGHAMQSTGRAAAGGAQDAHAGHAMPSTGRAAAGGAQDAHAGHAMPSTGRAAAGGAQDAHAGHAAPASADPHAGHSAAGASASRPRPVLPARTDGALQPDPFDAPAPVSVQEAQKAAGTAAPVDSSDENAVYVCPMHPEVTSTTPGATCPKCGMALVKK
jgi:hypothetical protein